MSGKIKWLLNGSNFKLGEKVKLVYSKKVLGHVFMIAVVDISIIFDVLKN